jgi:perosamine synthetase
MSYQLSARQFLKKLPWYPPAETKIPLRAILSAVLSKSDDFEKALCSYLGVKHCILANSGRALLALLLEILKKNDTDNRKEVLIPGYTCYSVAASVVKAGLTIRVYDINPTTLRPDIESLSEAISDNTLAIIVQHLFGLPSPLNDLQKIAKKKDIYLIEDAAQALGASLNGLPTGTIGDFGFYSFGRGKSLPVGCGGALIGKYEDVISELEFNKKKAGLTPLLKTAMVQLLSWPMLYWLPELLPLGLGETIFDPTFNISTMPAIMERLANNSLHTLEELNAHRRHIANVCREVFHNESATTLQNGTTPIYTRFPYMAGPGKISAELKRRGVRRMYPNAIVDEETIKPYLSVKQISTPGASKIAQNLITLPTHMGINMNLAKEIAQRIKTDMLNK